MNKQDRITMFKDFSVALGLSKEKVMILEAVCYKLEEIEKALVNCNDNPFSNSKYSFKHYNVNILNMFKNETQDNEVNPMRYYSVGKISQSLLLKLLNTVMKEFFDGKITKLYEMDECAAILISRLQYKLFKNTYTEGLLYILDGDKKDISPYFYGIINYDDFSASSFGYIVSDYYCNKIDNYEKVLFTNATLSNEDKRNIIIEVIKNSEIDREFLDSYILEKDDNDIEMFRSLLLDFLKWIDEHSGYYYEDSMRLFLTKSKLSIQASLFLLLKYIYANRYTQILNNEEIKQELLKNSKLKELFFRSIELLLSNPNIDGYEEVKHLIH